LTTIEVIAAASLCAWVYLVFGRGGFWRIRETAAPLPATERSVAVVIPARNEEQVVARAVNSLIQQRYPGRLHVFLVDDHSTDATVAAAGAHDRLTILRAGALPQGWTGKLWAISEGLERAAEFQPDYILLTDADVVHAPDSVSGLVGRAEAGNLDLVSMMVKLECRSFAERAVIPAFVFFFFKLYPPAWIGSKRRRTAGAAGGSILIRPSALQRIGGIEAIRGELIDDGALARAVKTGANMWLGVTGETRSIREYSTFAELRRMISRTAFTQLGHSTVLLAGTIVAMAVVYLAPPLLLLTRDPAAAICGLAAWALMTISYIPVLRFYGRSFIWAPFLPLVALFYMAATVESAILYWSGRGGQWKDRVQGAR
jgi:hopene-associated glycosyltransferase HpnB